MPDQIVGRQASIARRHLKMFFNLFDTYSIIVHVHREVQVDGNREHVVSVHDDLCGGGVGGHSLPHGVDVEGHVVEAGQGEQEI